MIDRQQISKALAGLAPEDREILDYSLRRRVPDADLATIFSSSASEVARRRAGAIDQLSTELGVERGADLGDLLKGLLETATWDGLAAETEAAEAAAAESARATAAAAPEVGGHRPLGAGNPRQASAVEEPADPEPEPARATPSGKGARRLLLAAGVAIAVLVPAGVVWALSRDTGSAATTASGGTGSNGGISTFNNQDNDKAAEPFPADPQVKGQYPTVRLERATALYEKPDGKVRLRVGARTEWKSPRILSIVERKGPWLAVLVPELKNGEKAWVRDTKVGSIGAVNWAIDADLSKRRLLVKHAGKVVRRVKIGVGREGHSTPTGRYAVTDRLRVTDSGGPYGCCVLALTGHQTRLPAGWPGGDRLAIHATQDLSGLGRAVSLGCMRTDPRDTRWLLKRIPLGTPVTIKS